MFDSDVDFYHFPFSEILSTNDELLSDEEKQRANRFIREIDQQRFRYCYTQLRTILSKHIGIAAHDIRFAKNAYGKPHVIDTQNPQHLQFNLSHSKHHIVIAVSQQMVGIDVEEMNRTVDMDGVANYAFSADELAQFQQLSTNKKHLGFYKAWTCKEAFIKAIGKGMHFPLKNFTVDVDPDNPAKLLTVSGDGLCVDDWHIECQQLDDNTMLALVTYNQSLATKNLS